MDYLIKKDNISITVNSKGAQMTSIIFNAKERLWQNENGSWGKHAPILFPHAGKCSVVVNGTHYPDQFHGFGRDLEFDLLDLQKDSITQILKNSDFTKNTYPFDFNLTIKYTCLDNGVLIEQTVKNPSKEVIYFFIGAHESYALDSEVENYYVEFENEEEFNENVINTGSVYGCNHNAIDLGSSMLENASTIVLHNIKSRKVWLKRKKDDSLVAETTFPGFPNLLLWHSLGSKMICIEPWMNMPDKPEDEEKEFKDKEHVIKVEPNQEVTLTRVIKYY